jgi:hypothetical protein
MASLTMYDVSVMTDHNDCVDKSPFFRPEIYGQQYCAAPMYRNLSDIGQKWTFEFFCPRFERPVSHDPEVLGRGELRRHNEVDLGSHFIDENAQFFLVGARIRIQVILLNEAYASQP